MAGGHREDANACGHSLVVGWKKPPATREERQNMSVDERTSEQDLKSDLQDLKTELAVQQATQAGAEATQAATQAGQAATNAAAHAGTWSTFVTGGVALSVGMFLALALVGATRR
jgi:hypothetical protein